jgi:hypothetical protein
MTAAEAIAEARMDADLRVAEARDAFSQVPTGDVCYSPSTQAHAYIEPCLREARPEYSLPEVKRLCHELTEIERMWGNLHVGSAHSALSRQLQRKVREARKGISTCRETAGRLRRDLEARQSGDVDALIDAMLERSPDRKSPPDPYAGTVYRRCSKKSRSLLEAIARQEEKTPRKENHVHLVMLATTLAEGELGSLLAEPSREVIDTILDAQKAHNPKYKTEALEAWHEGRCPTTLGIEVMILTGLRWGVDQDRSELYDFINVHFAEPYLGLVRDLRMGAALDFVREQYRNPAHHGKKTEYSYGEYKELCRTIGGKASIVSWLSRPGRVRPADIGVLHNHLLLTKMACAPEGQSHVQDDDNLPF